MNNGIENDIEIVLDFAAGYRYPLYANGSVFLQL